MDFTRAIVSVQGDQIVGAHGTLPTNIDLQWRSTVPPEFSLSVNSVPVGSPVLDFIVHQNMDFFGLGVLNTNPQAFTGYIDFDSFVFSNLGG